MGARVNFRSLLLPVLLLFLTACLPALPTTPPTLPPTSIPSTPTIPPSPTPTVTPTPSDLYLTRDDVFLYPGPELYTGDVVTFDVTPHNLEGIDLQALKVRIYHQTPDGAKVIAEGGVDYPSFDGVPRARFVWAWNTAGLEGVQHLTVRLDPDDRIQEGDENPANNSVTLIVRLLPAADRPPPEAGAAWATTTTECCILHYLTGTAAERDLDEIAATVQRAVDFAQERVGARLSAPLEVYLVGRVIAHGGYAQKALTVSYLDRHYAGSDLESVVRHEATHILDSEALAEWAPALVREGLAVWATGGHFKPEPIAHRAAALLELGWYIPLGKLANDFYRQQHEIGYLEGAAFVTYLIETYGWEGFRRFYTSFDAASETPAEALNRALAKSLRVGLSQAEGGFLEWLEDYPPSPQDVRDLELTVRLFNTVRRYQERYDPWAYFLTGWLPDPTVAEPMGIVADFLRHPREPENIALETMLIGAQEALRTGDFGQAEALLDGVDRVLAEGTFARSPEADYLAVVKTLAADGYEAQRIELTPTSARVQAIARWPVLTELTLEIDKNKTNKRMGELPLYCAVSWAGHGGNSGGSSSNQAP